MSGTVHEAVVGWWATARDRRARATREALAARCAPDARFAVDGGPAAARASLSLPAVKIAEYVTRHAAVFHACPA